MGFLDDLFGGKTEKVDNPPKTAKWTSATLARGALSSLSMQPISYPTRQIAGMTGLEDQGQSILAKIASGGAFENPLDSPYWLGLRQQMNLQREDDMATLNRQLSQTGGINSGPAGRAVGSYLARDSANRDSILGGLYENERNRDNPYTRLSAIATYGALPRMIQQQMMDAAYQKQVSDLLAPYQLQSPLWQQMIGNEVWYTPTLQSSPSLFSQISQFAPLAATMMAGIPGGSGAAAAGSGMSSGLNPSVGTNVAELGFDPYDLSTLSSGQAPYLGWN